MKPQRPISMADARDPRSEAQWRALGGPAGRQAGAGGGGRGRGGREAAPRAANGRRVGWGSGAPSGSRL